MKPIISFRTSNRTAPRRLGLVATVVLCAATQLGCYGQFALTRKLYTWNGTATNNKFANSLVMWGLIIIPVYELGSFVDLIILNPIEFYTGNNPVSATNETPAQGARTATLRFSRDGHDYKLTKNADDGVVDVERDGARALRYRETDDRVIVEDLTEGRVIDVERAQAYARANAGAPAY